MRTSFGEFLGILPTAAVSDRNFASSRTPHTQTSQCIDTVNVHGAAATDTLTARPAERQCRVVLVLDSNQGVQHHWTRLVQVQLV